LDVLNPVKTKFKTGNSKAKNHTAVESSSAAARARLERLGIGNSSGRGLLDQHPTGNADVEADVEADDKANDKDKSEPIRWLDHSGTCDIQIEKCTQASNSKLAKITGGIETHKITSVKAEKRSLSTDYIRNFHAYAISLTSVLVLSSWIFGYFILR